MSLISILDLLWVMEFGPVNPHDGTWIDQSMSVMQTTNFYCMTQKQNHCMCYVLSQ